MEDNKELDTLFKDYVDSNLRLEAVIKKITKSYRSGAKGIITDFVRRYYEIKKINGEL